MKLPARIVKAVIARLDDFSDGTARAMEYLRYDHDYHELRRMLLKDIEAAIEADKEAPKPYRHPCTLCGARPEY